MDEATVAEPERKTDKKPHCAMCQSGETMVNGHWVICKKCGFRRKTSK